MIFFLIHLNCLISDQIIYVRLKGNILQRANYSDLNIMKLDLQNVLTNMNKNKFKPNLLMLVIGSFKETAYGFIMSNTVLLFDHIVSF